mgnify:FL=1|jgi:hypothetical protein
MDWLESEVANARDEMMSSLNLLEHDIAQIKYITLLKTYNKAKELAL